MTEGDVRITQREIYDEVVGLKDGLGRVESLMTQHIALEAQRNEAVELRLENHGTRIAGTEGRVTQAESDIRTLREAQEAQEKKEVRKATWPQVVGVALGGIAGAGGLVALFVSLSNLSAAISNVSP